MIYTIVGISDEKTEDNRSLLLQGYDSSTDGRLSQ
jgi:hypothetical protein